MKPVRSLILAAALLGAGFVAAQEASPAATAATQNPVLVQDAWVRSTVPGQKVSAAYMQLKAQEAGWAVVGVRSSASARAEIHDMRMDKDVMRMFAIDNLPLPQGQTVSLQPAGKHIMLMALHAPLKEGDSVQVQLQLRHAQGQERSLELQVPVRPMMPASPYHAPKAMMHAH